jgi:hypothetical protein
MDNYMKLLMFKRNKICIQLISLQMQWFDFQFLQAFPSQVGNLSQQTELRLHGSMQRYALASYMLCFWQQSFEDEYGFLKHQIFGSFILGLS